MAESSPYIAGARPTYTIIHEDGSVVTPQEIYDAFMSGPVILARATNTFNEETYVTSIVWYGASTDAIQGIIINAIGAESGTINITIGDVSGG